MRERPDILLMVEFVPSFTGPHDLPIPLLGICSRDLTSCFTNTCTAMFITSLFTIAKEWKQIKCPSTNECIMAIWYFYTIEYYSAIKENEIMKFTD